MEHSKNHLSCNLPDEAATLLAGTALAPQLKAGDCILLQGDLGAGKTTFVRGLLRGHAAQHHITQFDVPSPTFTLVQLYPFADLTFYHYDLYRLPEEDNELDLMEIGFAESLETGIALVEWPERLGLATPSDALYLNLSITADGSRQLTWHGTGTWASRASQIFTEQVTA